ncbi:MAG TPA: hypothetical protein VGL57_04430 [Solirubrobacteraceae bacterium]|jgi:hypothetical protein
MTENDPFEDLRPRPQYTKVELRGPNVSTSFDRPPRPGAIKVQQAAIRKHLDRRAPRRPPRDGL